MRSRHVSERTNPTGSERTKLTGSARARKAVTARLSTVNWTDMARPAFSARNHVGRLQRWIDMARRSNPTLNDEQAERLARRLRTEYFAMLGRRSGTSRRATRQAAAPVQAVMAPAEQVA
jgi:hypothetical protein